MRLLYFTSADTMWLPQSTQCTDGEKSTVGCTDILCVCLDNRQIWRVCYPMRYVVLNDHRRLYLSTNLSPLSCQNPCLSRPSQEKYADSRVKCQSDP